KLFIIIILQLLTCCSPKIHNTNQTNSGVPKISFCDLPKYESQLVLIEGSYSGIDEYWAINSLKKCKEKFNVELDYYKDGKPIPKEYQTIFDSAYSSYWNTFLIIKIIGKYDSKNPSGYGHLGSNKSRFIVEEFIDIKLMKR
ncbi:MAG TPA: hypothetical protein VF144_19255, partial [Chitinophagaceae bacterium]